MAKENIYNNKNSDNIDNNDNCDNTDNNDNSYHYAINYNNGNSDN